MEQNQSKFFIDSTGKRWPVWGDKSQDEMADWVESIYRQSRDAELKAKLLIVVSAIGTVAIGYSIWQIKRSFPKWRADRNKVSRLEKEWKEERLRELETEVSVLYFQGSEINAPTLKGYRVETLTAV